MAEGHFKWECPRGVLGKSHGGGQGAKLPEPEGTVKICYFELVLRCMHEYTNQFNLLNGRKINLEA